MHTIHVEWLQHDYELFRTMLDDMTMLDMNSFPCVWMNANVCISYGLNAGYRS